MMQLDLSAAFNFLLATGPEAVKIPLSMLIVFGSAKLMAELFERLRQPAIVGEIVAGMVLGWNFGDGHLHREQLLRAVQEQCGFEEGELRCVFVESQPLGRATLEYRILDAKTGLLERGELDVHALRRCQPWAAEEA